MHKLSLQSRLLLYVHVDIVHVGQFRASNYARRIQDFAVELQRDLAGWWNAFVLAKGIDDTGYQR